MTGPREIVPGIHWIGALDPGLRVFDIIMETRFGTSYNSYLVRGRKAAVVDTVKDRFAADYLAGIKAFTDPEEIEYVVVNHTEPDHSGALGALLDAAPRATVLCTRPAALFLRGLLNREFPYKIVSDGEAIDLGGKTLRFVHAPFLHWPDSMFTYVPEDRLLFTCDGLGSHYADERLYSDLVGENADTAEAYRYYYDMIMRPFAAKVLEAIGKVRDLPVDVVAPSHGPVHRRGWRRYLDLYEKWSREQVALQSAKTSVVVAYVSAHGKTEQMAGEIARGAKSVEHVQVEVYDLVRAELPDVALAVQAARAFAVGSPTINADAVKPVWDLLSLVSPVTNRGKVCLAFGSYGWSGEGVPMLHERLHGLKLKPLEPLRWVFSPSEEDMAKGYELGRQLALATLPPGDGK